MFQNFHIMMFFLLCFLYYPSLSFSLPFQNSSSNHLCHQDDKMSLLHFKNGFTIDPINSENSDFFDNYYGIHFRSYPKTNSWRVSIDCCLWDGVTCDSNSGHVIGVDLSHSQLGGIIHPNSTLFQLSHLQSLNLADNYFKESHIPSNMGHFSNLRVLNLSYCGFTGDTPTELGLLSHLVSLDLSSYDSNNKLTMPYIDMIVKNLTHLRELHLSGVLINSSIPHTFSSSLSSLDLSDCSLQGAFPSNILSLPHLRFLSVQGNNNLYSNASHFNNLSSSLEAIDFSYTNLSGRLPDEYTLGERRPPQLRGFEAANCRLNGIIPMWVWNTTESIWLSYNQFSGELPSSINTKDFPQFHSLGLSYNFLKGPIPSWLFNIPSLKSLHLNGNQFTGKVAFPKHNCSFEDLGLSGNNLSLELNSFSNCNLDSLYLRDIDLSDVSLIGGVNSTFSLPNLIYLYMPSCNITIFPNFLKSTLILKYLDLSNNRIQGEIPTWFYNVGKNSLENLNISHNRLTGGLELHPWKVLVDIDIRSNSFQGLLPLPSSNYTNVFLASSNQFHGKITSSFCNLTVLDFLDLSNNSLSGNIPQCFEKLSNSLSYLHLGSNKFQGKITPSFCNLANLYYLNLSNNSLRGNIPQCLGKLSSNLQVLILGSNNFHGIIPKTFTKNCKLQSIHLNDNQFEGTIPQSLKRCKLLEVLDLGSNRFNDSFPRWLDDLPELKVLVLRSNYFQGSINDELKENINPFPKLQILDLSRNQFSGRLPTSYIKKFKALMVENGDSNSKTNGTVLDLYYYQDSLVLTMKGLSLTYKILSILTTLDFSNNQFSGEIPESIGELIALVALNVSHNQLTGRVPSSLAKLTSLESLDLSCNMLEGRIPSQLVSLTFLEYFNVSNNQLSGSIPQCTQFSTFPIDSFEGNLGLCGDPLPKCGNGGVHQTTMSTSQQEVNGFIDIITSISLWEIILIGFGLGATLGSVAGYFMLSSKKPNWFSRKAGKFEDAMMQRYKKQSRRQQRRA